MYELEQAVRNNDLAQVKKLVAAGAKTNIQIEEGDIKFGIVHLAAKLGHVEILTYLKSRYISLDVLSSDGSSPLHFAKDGDTALFFLNNERSINPNSWNNKQRSALYQAILDVRIDVAKVLLEKANTFRSFPRYLDTALYAAVYEALNTQEADKAARYYELIEYLIEHYPGYLNHKTIDNIYYDTPLHLAARFEPKEPAIKKLINLLFAKNPSLIENEKTATSLLKKTHPELYISLSTSYPNKFLLAAIVDNDVSEVKRLLSLGADCNTYEEKHHKTALHIAAEYASTDILNLLIVGGAKINALDNKSRTPLHFVKTQANAAFLLAHDADKNAVDINNNTPMLRVAAKVHDDECLPPTLREVKVGDKQCLKIIKLLLDHQADCHVKNKKGDNLLLRVIQFSNYEFSDDKKQILDRLLAAGMDLNETIGFYKKPALSYAYDYFYGMNYQQRLFDNSISNQPQPPNKPIPIIEYLEGKKNLLANQKNDRSRPHQIRSLSF